MNRGVAKRRVFESEKDIRYFLSLVAREVRRGTIKVHAYCVLSTHFHLLVESTRGELSAAMQRIEGRYAQRFNWRRRRDGALFRSRFLAKPVGTDPYKYVLFPYIDGNVPSSGIAGSPERFRYCTAFHWATGRMPPWLARDWVDGELRLLAKTPGNQASYAALFGAPLTKEQMACLDSLSSTRTDGVDPVERLFGAAPRAVREWLDSRSQHADGTRGRKLIGVETLDGILQRFERRIDGLGKDRGRLPLASVVRTSMLRDLCGLTRSEIAVRTGVSSRSVSARYARHLERLDSDESYASLLVEIGTAAMRSYGRNFRAGV